MAAESFKIYSLQNDGTRIPAMVFAEQTSVEEEDVPSSSVKEITTAELTAMDIAARKAMYEDGIRLLQVYNDNITVLLSLDVNGETRWVSGYKPKNLLDNSDFTNLINQRGQSTYNSSTYAIDRWYLYVTNNSNLIVENGYIALTAHMYQKLLNIKSDTVYTLAAKHLNGSLTIISHVFPETGDGLSPINFYYTNGVATIRLGPGEYLWAALYEGEYTADTLPTYVPKGYTTELSECKRYFQKNTSQGKFFGDTSGNAGYVYVPYEQEMRAIPTLSVTANGSLIGEQAQGLAISSTPVAVNSSTTGMTVQVKNSGNTYILCAWSEPSFTLSADL